MNIFEGTLEECVKAAWDKPELIQALEVNKYEDKVFLSKLLKEDPSLVALLQPHQFGTDAYMAMLENDLESYDRIPKAHRTDEIKIKALSINTGIIYLFEPDDISYEVVKYLFVHAPYALEELPKPMQKEIKPHLKRIKKEGIVSEYNEDDLEIEQLDPNDLPDYDDED